MMRVVQKEPHPSDFETVRAQVMFARHSVHDSVAAQPDAKRD
jgi:hypothetical protein